MAKVIFTPLSGISPYIEKERPNLRSGIISLLNVRGGMRFKRYIFDNDRDTIRKDWETVGNDIRIALSIYGKK